VTSKANRRPFLLFINGGSIGESLERPYGID